MLLKICGSNAIACYVHVCVKFVAVSFYNLITFSFYLILFFFFEARGVESKLCQVLFLYLYTEVC